MNYLYLIIIVYLIPLISYIIFINILKKYDNITNNKELSGFEVAKTILDKNKLDNMYIVEKKGTFTDTFDSKQNVLRLSTPVFHNESLYSLSISSYFATKAILYNKNDKTIKNKVTIDNFINILITFVYLLLLVGIILNSIPTYKVVLVILGTIIIYNIITIPIEKKILEESVKNLSKNKYLDKNEKEIKNIYNYMTIYNLSQIVLALSNLYFNIRDDIKK